MKRRVCAIVEAASVRGRNPLLGPLGLRLATRGVELTVWDPTEGFELPLVAPEADLYLLKGDHPAVLTAAGCLADRGARCLNTLEVTAAVTDKARTLSRLLRAGLPVPVTKVLATSTGLASALDGQQRYVKPVRGAHGEGVELLSRGEEGFAGSGPWLIQEVVYGPGYDLKAYGVGDRVALRRVRTIPGVIETLRVPERAPDPQLLSLAQAAAELTGLACYGVDFVVGSSGPMIVDVNAFPGYRGVEEAPVWVADAVMRELLA